MCAALLMCVRWVTDVSILICWCMYARLLIYVSWVTDECTLGY